MAREYSSESVILRSVFFTLGWCPGVAAFSREPREHIGENNLSRERHLESGLTAGASLFVRLAHLKEPVGSSHDISSLTSIPPARLDFG